MFLRRDRRTAVGITVTLCIIFLRLTFWLFGEWLDNQENRSYDLDLTPRAPTSQHKEDVLTLLAPSTPFQDHNATLLAQRTETASAAYRQTLKAEIATSTPTSISASSNKVSSP